MQQKFSAGQMVTIIRANMFPELLGFKVRILKALGSGEYALDLPYKGGYVVAVESALALAYDGNKRVAWDDCAWKPVKV